MRQAAPTHYISSAGPLTHGVVGIASLSLSSPRAASLISIVLSRANDKVLIKYCFSWLRAVLRGRKRAPRIIAQNHSGTNLYALRRTDSEIGSRFASNKVSLAMLKNT
jgi:hypothetical protein